MKPSYAEQFQVEDNKAHYDERNAHRKELVTNLSDLLKQDANGDTIVSRLTELGFKTEEGFAEKNADEMGEGIRELIAHMEESSNGVLKITKTVRNRYCC